MKYTLLTSTALSLALFAGSPPALAAPAKQQCWQFQIGQMMFDGARGNTDNFDPPPKSEPPGDDDTGDDDDDQGDDDDDDDGGCKDPESY
jgi:hypothetical protein